MSREAMQMALEALESDPISHAGLVNRKQAITALRQALETKQEPVALPCVYITSQKDGGNCYGDGTVYRGQRSKDSETPTLNLQSTMEMWERAYEQVCEERDAIVKDLNKAYELLRWAETEMRYAKWGTRLNDQHGRTDVYTAIVEFLEKSNG